MRNDVKLGFAIGGVLLAVVIVFALVNSSKPPAEAPADQASAQTDKPADATPVIETARPTQTETSKPLVAAATSTTPSGATGGTSATSNPPAGTIITPPTETATTTTPPAGGTDPWGDALKTGKLPMMSSSTVGSSSSPTTPPTIVGSQPRNTTETPVNATSNTPAALGGGVSERTGSRTTGALTSHKQQDDADRAVREGARAAGPTSSQPVTTVTDSKTVPARTHTIKSGETFSTIATAYYGHIRYNKLIAKANPGVDSSKLKIGQVINLPAFDPKSDSAAASPTALTKVVAIDSKSQYRVQKGDSLHAISMKLYGDAKHVDALYDTNKNAIGPVREKLKLDMVLQLPAPPTVALK